MTWSRNLLFALLWFIFTKSSFDDCNFMARPYKHHLSSEIASEAAPYLLILPHPYSHIHGIFGITFSLQTWWATWSLAKSLDFIRSMQWTFLYGLNLCLQILDVILLAWVDTVMTEVQFVFWCSVCNCSSCRFQAILQHLPSFSSTDRLNSALSRDNWLGFY